MPNAYGRSPIADGNDRALAYSSVSFNVTMLAGTMQLETGRHSETDRHVLPITAICHHGRESAPVRRHNIGMGDDGSPT